jgi:diguanylate cyclase (GGDEF)-like protein/PAS domain S-box-containing protein
VVWDGILVDLTAHRAEQAAQIEREQRWQFALEGAGDGVWDWNLQTGQAVYSRRWKAMFGYDESDIGGTAEEWASRVHPDDMPGVMQALQRHLDGHTPSVEVEFRLRRKDCSWSWTLGRGMLVSRSADGQPLRLVGTNADITQRKTLEARLHQLAFYDALTQLPNRRLLLDRLAHTIAACRRTGRHGALLFLDLDNFKSLNDRAGHAVGDLLLVEAAQRLKACVREMDTVARLGGDEFVVMTDELDVERAGAAQQALLIAQKIRLALAAPYRLSAAGAAQAAQAVEHRCSASIGVCLLPTDAGTVDDALSSADMAMYLAKQAGPSSILSADLAAGSDAATAALQGAG